MKVQCIKRYSDIRLKEIIEVGTVLEVDKERAEHLIHDGVAEAVKVIQTSPSGTQGEASYFCVFFCQTLKKQIP